MEVKNTSLIFTATYNEKENEKELIDEINIYSPDSFIFKGRNNKTSLTTRAFQKVLSKAVERAALTGFSSHGYRQT